MLNWLLRYGPVVPLVRGFGDSILDVGCGVLGLAVVDPELRFVGVDTDPLTPPPSMIGFRISPGGLPFADAAFGSVCCLDTLEHVPRQERAAFVADLARVAAHRLVLVCPTDEAAPTDDLLRELFTCFGQPIPDWLAEHEHYGLPARSEVEGLVHGLPAFEARPLQMVNELAYRTLVLGDFLPRLAQRAAAEFRDARERWIEYLEGARFGASSHAAFLLERTRPLEPLVGSATPPDEVLAALRDPDRAERVPSSPGWPPRA